MSTFQNFVRFGAKCPGAKCPWGILSWGILSMGQNVLGAKCLLARKLWLFLLTIKQRKCQHWWSLSLFVVEIELNFKIYTTAAATVATNFKSVPCIWSYLIVIRWASLLSLYRRRHHCHQELCQNQRRSTTSPTASLSSSSLPSMYERLPSPPRSTTLTQVSPPEKYQLVLVSSDCSEDGLGEDPSLVAHLYNVQCTMYKFEIPEIFSSSVFFAHWTIPQWPKTPMYYVLLMKYKC